MIGNYVMKKIKEKKKVTKKADFSKQYLVNKSGQ